MSADSVQDVIDASRALGDAGLGDLVWGHASVRDPAGRGAWMKASGFGFEEVGPDQVVLVDPLGEVVVGSAPRHIEYSIHTSIYAARSDVGSVVHTHAPALSAFSSLGVPLVAISHDAVPFVTPQIPRFTTTGALIASRQLGDELAVQLGTSRAILMPKHGAVTVGPDCAAAVMYAVLLERACRTALSAIAAGGPRIWSDDEETTLKLEQIWNPAGLSIGYEYLVRRSRRGPLSD